MNAGLSAALLGTSIAASAATFLIFRLVKEMPREDRTYKDRPPALLRFVWVPTQLLAWVLGPRLSLHARENILKQLRKAELDLSVSPQQWFAARLSLAAAFALIAASLASLLEWSGMWAASMGVGAGFYWPQLWLSDRIKRNEIHMLKDLPTYLDVLTLAIEGGCNLTSAISIAVEKGSDGPLRRAFERLLREVRAGKPRADAMKSMEERIDMPAITSLATAMIQAERTGAALGSVLRAQATQRTNERFARAEKLAMEAPVKMLGPLIMCIFPCTFIVLAFPIAMKFMQGF